MRFSHLAKRITNLAERTGTTPPDVIRLIPEDTVRVHQESAWLWLRPGPRTLYLGEPTLTTTAPAQLDSRITYELYRSSANTRIPLTPLLTRSRQDITRQLTRPTPTGQGIARQSATALRDWHARHYLKTTQRLMNTLDNNAKAAATGISSGLQYGS